MKQQKSRPILSVFMAVYWAVYFGLLCSTSAFAVSLNDISVLLPLPTAQEKPLMIKPKEGAGGPLLSRDVFDQLPRLLGKETSATLYEEDLRVIAVRFDPCFVEGALNGTPLKCRHQIRLVWQPVSVTGAAVEAEDGAVHTFYDFDDVKWDEVMLAWRHLGITGDEHVALTVNPRAAKEGFAGPYLTGLKNLIVRYCGEKNLTRVTSIAMSRKMIWAFSGFDVVAGKTTAIQIARVQKAAQVYFIDQTNFGNLREFIASAAPFPKTENEYLSLLNNSVAYQGARSESEIKAVVGETYDFENPQKHNPGTLDCVSCHTSQMVRAWGEWKFPNWRGDGRGYTSAYNLENRSVGANQANRVRAFGYFGREPVISQRTINETANILSQVW